MADKMAWVGSKTGKAIHLVDQSKIIDKDYVRIGIDRRMAENDIPIQVPLTSFIESNASEFMGLLKIWHDPDAAKKKHDDFFKIVEAEQKTKASEIKTQSKIEKDAIEAAQKAFREVLDKASKKTDAKPRIIRHEAGA